MKGKKSKKDEVLKVDLPDKEIRFEELIRLIAKPEKKTPVKKKAPLRLEDIPIKSKKKQSK